MAGRLSTDGRGPRVRLSDVSKTAITTLRSRVIESNRSSPLIEDPIAPDCLRRLADLATDEERALLFARSLSPALTRHIALRARKYDRTINEFISANPSCLVVNLGCGFDTRYWRIDHASCEYVDLDLPEIIALKRKALGHRAAYQMIGASVLDPSWMEEVNPDGHRKALLIAEGLFMYLPKAKVVSLFGSIVERFRGSRLIFEVVTEKYTRGFWKRVAAGKMRRQLGYDAGLAYEFGVRNAREIESYADGLRIVEEWSYFEDPDLRPRFLRYLGLTRTQWTVTAEVGE